MTGGSDSAHIDGFSVHSRGDGRAALRDDHLHGSLEQRIGAVRLDLGQRVGVILQPLDRELARRGRHKVGGTVCLCRLTGHVPHILRGIEGTGEIVVVRTVLDQELNLGSVAASIGEVLVHVKAEAVDRSIVGQGVIEAGVAALPGQGDFIGVAGIAEDEGIIRVQRDPIGDAQGAVAVSAVDRGGSGIDGAAGVDFAETCRRHGDGHDALAVRARGISYGELLAVCGPGGDFVGAGRFTVELQHNIVLLVGDAGAQGIHEGVLREIRGSRGDAGEGADDLILNRVAGRCGGGFRIPVRDGGAAVVLAGGGLCLPHGLIQRGQAGQVLRIDHYVIDPRAAAGGGGGHRDADQEGCGGAGDHLRDAGFNEEIQAQGKIACSAVAVSVRGGHCRAAVVYNIGFQRVLYRGGVAGQGVLKAGDQGVGAIVVRRYTARCIVCGVTVIGADTDGGQKGGVGRIVDDAVHQLGAFHVVVRYGYALELGHLEIGVHHALNRVPA